MKNMSLLNLGRSRPCDIFDIQWRVACPDNLACLPSRRLWIETLEIEVTWDWVRDGGGKDLFVRDDRMGDNPAFLTF